MNNPDVLDAMSFSIGDPDLGEDIAVMVVARGPFVTEERLRDYLLDRLVPFKVPRRICFVDTIPRTQTGKLIRYEGKRQFSGKP